MSIVKEFREFAVKGNVVDLAVGVIIGGAFGKIVTSLVDDVVMPPLGLILGKVNFADKFVVLPGQDEAITKAEAAGKPLTSLANAKAAGVNVLAWGNFVNVLVQFALVAFAVFLLVKAINAVRRKEAEVPAAPAAPTTEEKLLTEIRDLLAAGR